MQSQPFAIGISARYTGGYYFGAILSGIHEQARQADVLLLVVQAGAPEASRPIANALFRQFRIGMMRARLAYEAAKNQYLTGSAIMNQHISLALLSSQVGESQTLAWLNKTSATWGRLGLWDDPQADTSARLTVAGVYQRDSDPLVAIGTRYSPGAFPPFEALPPLARQGQDLTIVSPPRAGAEDLAILALCGFAGQKFTFDTEMLTIHAGLLAATLKRDAMVRHLETQARAAQLAHHDPAL